MEHTLAPIFLLGVGFPFLSTLGYCHLVARTASASGRSFLPVCSLSLVLFLIGLAAASSTGFGRGAQEDMVCGWLPSSIACVSVNRVKR